MANDVNRDDLRAYLNDGVRMGVVGTTRDDGRPHAAPVWFALDEAGNEWGFDLVFTTSVESVKGRNLRRDGRAVLSVADNAHPYPSAAIQGTVTTTEDPAELLRWATAIAGRYLGEDLAEAGGERNAAPGEMVVRVSPTNVMYIPGV